MATESFFSNASLAYLASAGAGKDGKTYSIKPTDGTGDFTFSRGSNLTATRVGPTGLIEKGRENLLTYSNAFDTLPWVLSNGASVGSRVADPNGGNDAWELNYDGTVGGRIQQQVSITDGGVYVFSIYAKVPSGTRDLQFYTTISASPITITLTTTWQRFELFRTNVGYTQAFPQLRDNTGIAGTIHIYQAQYEAGTIATDYIESGASTGKAGLLENEPRFDYHDQNSPNPKTCPSLLLEPQRVQLVTSEYFEPSATDWRSEGTNGVTITTNDTTSPEGLVNASKLQGGGASNDRLQWNFSTSNTKAIYSVFVKGAGDAVRFSLFNSRSGDRLNYDVDTSGNFTLNSATGITNHDIENYGNGWYRIWGEFTTDAALTNYFQIYSDITGSGAIYLYGAQLEDNASYPTSYIPNHSGGSATRTEDDVKVLTGVGVTGDEFSIFLELDLSDTPLVTNLGTYFQTFDSLNNSQQEFRFFNWAGEQVLVPYFRQDGTYAFGNGSNAVRFDGKILFRADGGGSYTMFFGFNGGSTKEVRTGLTAYTLNKIDFISQPKTNLKQLLIFNEALSDADCITLTT